ncbi:MAG TPA: endo-1,4-beta-xylanase, partial [Cytophagales bacterium]
FHFPEAGTFYIDHISIPAPAAPPVSAPNLLPNGGFESDLANWFTQASSPAAATFSVVSGDAPQGTKALKVDVTTPGPNPWSVQAINDAWVAETGKTYTLTFYARAAAAGSTFKVIQQNQTYAEKIFTLTTAWQKYDWTFTAQEASLQLKFHFPNAGTFYLDDFVIPKPGSVTPPPPPCTPPAFPLPALALGKPKFLGGVYSASQLPNFTSYFNQVVPENAGKWGSVEAARDVRNWTELDAAYQLAEDNGFPFRFHVLVWGNQQPAWIETLPPAEQLEEIKEWYAAVAARYPGIDFLEVVNEPTNDPPNAPGNGGGNYVNALGGSGATGWDWVLTSFRLARQYFPSAKLMINDYNVESTPANVQRYLGIINLLKAENLVDAIGLQAHAFSTRFATAAALKATLDQYQATGLPVYVTELDIDGQTDQIQLDEYKRVFPVYWEHPAVAGVTLWGYRPGHWRTAQGAFLATAEGCERPALAWLRRYVGNNAPVAALTAAPSGGFAPLPVAFDGSASADADNEALSYEWNFGNGATATGQTAAYTYTVPGTYTVTLTVKDGYGATGTATAMVAVAPGLKVQYRVRPDGHRTTDNRIKPHFQVVNVGDKAVPYGELTLRYWYTRENAAYPWAADNTGQQFWVDYAA